MFVELWALIGKNTVIVCFFFQSLVNNLHDINLIFQGEKAQLQMQVSDFSLKAQQYKVGALLVFLFIKLQKQPPSSCCVLHGTNLKCD